MFFIYTFLIRLYQLAIRVASLFNTKARNWVKGRQGIFDSLEKKVKHDRPIAWFHCASLGEFEQGRPLMEAFKTSFPEYRILLTFFSPSGYEIRKNYPGADYIFYLPADTTRNAKRFVRISKPQLAVFIKYEFWFNYLRQLNKQDVPVISVSSIFRPKQRFFRWHGKWQLSMLKKLNHFFVQNQASADLLIHSGITQVSVSGDTRFDRVYATAQEKKSFPLVETFAKGQAVFLAGSTWPRDEELILSLPEKHPGLRFIIAPHEVHKERIDSLMKQLPESSLRFSQANSGNIEAASFLVIDSIGILSHLYQYASIAYIGGGFGVGIHNILEAATFGNPVIFGPNYQKFQEARELIRLGGAFSIHHSEELNDITSRLLSHQQYFDKASQTTQKYVEENRGATELIIGNLKKIL